ncbi:UNVERIFIED_CONTAM: hypothetical protein Slati_1209800 [Sesamum latifolium]|uniref:Bet v I/Major latex protein domain-containing protein n=1 Tax=Sesamum latifolium TaxID=2727402 RepID=A0AAW2XE67_9LAMI
MEGSISMKLEVNASASETWKVYGSLLLPKIIMDTFPDKYSELKVVKGDGHSGTIVEVFFASGVPGPKWYREEYVVVDDVKRFKLAKILKGGVLEQGFKSYVTRLEAIEKEGKPDACIITGTVDYMLEDESGLQVISGAVEAFYQILKAVADYVIKHHNTTTTN